jgi:hypothetical protein
MKKQNHLMIQKINNYNSYYNFFLIEFTKTKTIEKLNRSYQNCLEKGDNMKLLC